MKLKHPAGLYILFFTEMWERFSFYGMRALLVLYMTKIYLFSDHKAYGIYGAYMALVYTTPVIGGLLADRLLGFKRAIVIGSILIMLGHACLTLPSHTLFYLGLSFVIAGTGFFKSTISSLVGELYPADDPRRESGFTIFYMGINLGALLATLLCGLVAETFGWHYGFGLAAIGMLLGLINFSFGCKYLGKHGSSPNKTLLLKPIFPGINLQTLIIIAACLSVLLFSLLLQHDVLVGYLLIIMGIITLLFILWLAFSLPKEERINLFMLLFLFLLAIVFFALFEQSGSSMILFTERSINRTFANWTIPSAVFHSLNPFYILLLSPFFAQLWLKLNQTHHSPSYLVKFSIGIFLAGLGFLVLVIGSYYLDKNFKINLNWIVLAYLLHTIGELCISPIGLSAVTTLAPKKWIGMLMGCWFLAIAFSEYLGALIARLTAYIPTASRPTEPATYMIYIHVFKYIGWIAVIISLVLFVAVFCRRLYIKKHTPS